MNGAEPHKKQDSCPHHSIQKLKRGTVFEYDGLRFKAQDNEICSLLADAAIFEKAGTCSLKTAMRVALECQRITLADLPVPLGLI
jgi:hypothetical protein